MKAVTAIFVSAALSAVFVSCGVYADGRIEKIRESGAITIGFPETSLPFSYLDGNQKPVGYTVEICEQVAHKIQSALGLKSIDINFNPTTSSTRIPLLANGTIDLECGSTTNKADRHNLVWFSPTTFVAQIVIVAKKDTKVDVNDLKSFSGKSIAATAGGQTFKAIASANAEKNYGISVLPAKDTGEAFLMLSSGRAAGIANDDGLAYASVASSKNPEDYVISTQGLELAPYAILEPKDDVEFKALVDKSVVELMKDGTVEKIYNKYFTSPIPPRGINLKYAMSESLKRALAKPTDSPDPAAYE